MADAAGNGDRPRWWVLISSEDLVQVHIATPEGCPPEVAEGLVARAAQYLRRQLLVRDLLTARPRIVPPR